MKVAVLSDIHSNIDALKAVVADARDWGAVRWMVAGDVVGYGAEPDECIGLLKDLDAVCIAGNHDWGTLERTPIRDFNSHARQAIEWTRKHISSQSRIWLESLPLRYETDEISLVHANFLTPESWDYVFTIQQAKNQFEGFATPLGMIGHSHIPFIVGSGEGGETKGWAEQLKETQTSWSEGRFLINCGSVGQPRDGDPRASYLRIELSVKTMFLQRVAYDSLTACVRIKKAGLPARLGERLLSGR